jgi:hypothetical protein
MKTINRKLSEISGKDLDFLDMIRLRGGDEGGTGTCGYYFEVPNTFEGIPDYWFGFSVCEVSQAEALSQYMNGRNGKWCCDSCYKTTYCATGLGPGPHIWELEGGGFE